jgi:hypothetical protein
VSTLADDLHLRRRGARFLFGSVAVGTTAYVASITVSPLVGEDLTRSATLAGFPWAAGVLGTGVAGRRRSLVLG